MSNDSDTGLPASIEVAWGLRERPAKGPKRGLSLERIVEAAMRVAASDGLAAVSMSRVAAELGTGTMSLYRYVSAKDELLALMADAAYSAPPDVPPPDEGWRAGLSRWAWSMRAVLRRHPWVLRVPISGPPALPNQLAWMEEALRCLRDTDLDEGAKLSVVLLVSGFVRSEATLARDLFETATASDSTEQEAAQEAMSGYGHLLATLTDADQFPALHAVIAAGVLDEADEVDDEFVFGLERVLDGIDVLVRTSAAESPVTATAPDPPPA